MVQYIGIDKQRYDAGNKFLSQDTYLQNYQTKAPITFNPSRSNTGIMSQYPYPYPIIPQEGGGDGGGPPGPRGPGYGYTSIYDPITQNKEFQDDVGVGTITKEEEDFAKAQELRRGLVTIGKAALFGPIEYTLGSGITKGIGFGINKAKDFFSDGDEIDINKDNVFTKESIDSYFRGEEGPTGGSTTASSGTVDTGNFEQDGTGRQGYRDGGMPMKEIKGQDHMLAYITPNEADKLVKLGGQETMTPEGIPAYPEYDNYGYSNQADFDQGNYSKSNDPTVSSYAGKNTNTGGGNPPQITQGSNLNYTATQDINPSFNYAGNFGRFGGLLDLTRTIQEEEPVGNIGYLDPSGNFTIGYDTDLGTVGNANLGNLNIGYTGQGGPAANYMGGFAGDAGRFGANYNRDTGLNFGLTFNKKFNNGGIVGMYR